MSERADLVGHRCMQIGALADHHRRLVDRSRLVAAVVGSSADEAAGERDHLAGAGFSAVGAPDVAALLAHDEAFDLVVLYPTVTPTDLDALASVLARDALVVVHAPGAGAPVALADELRARFAEVAELVQTTVSGSAIIEAASAGGRPLIFPEGGGTHRTTEHTMLVASDRDLTTYPTCSVHHSSTAAPDQGRAARHDLTAGARRAAGAIKRRLRPAERVDSTIEVPNDSEPELSVVIPVHGKWSLTEGCLASLDPSSITTTAEIIVVNDASPDDTIEQLQRVPAAKVVDLVDNVGFLRASNAGLERARGELVLFLNNDTIPQPGAIDRMVETMRSDPTIGVVGAKLVYFDRTLQEAGGVVWNDGSAWNLGRGGDPGAPRHSYPLEVDYCSGAALLVRRTLLDSTGGFDERYSPAYYEDTDLCFEARRHGLRVVYEPRARVVHLEGQSHGTSVTSGVKRYQEINREKFAAKWADELEHHLPPVPANPHLAKSRLAAHRVLVVDHTVPTSDRDGGSMRMLRLLRILREMRCFVWFHPADRLLRQPYTRQLLDLGVEVVGPRDDLTDLLSSIGPRLDAVILSRRGVAWHMMEALREHAPGARLVFDTVDLHFVREETEGAESHDVLVAGRAARGRAMELGLASMTDQTWVVSTREQTLLAELLPTADVRLIPNVHDAEPTLEPYEQRADLVFVGNFNHPPNVDGLVWFDDEVLPLIRKALPDVRLHVVGDALPAEVADALDEACVVHGWVRDLRPIYAAARLAVAPLRYGAGMKGKVTEALALGVPVITTEVGVEGMPHTVRDLVRIGDAAEVFAQLTVDAYQDREWWTGVHEAAPRVVDDAYGHAAVRRMVNDALGFADASSSAR